MMYQTWITPAFGRRVRGSGGLALALLMLAGCAQTFPQPDPEHEFTDGLSADALFERTLAAHGGDLREHPGDINLATDGDWGWWIQRIQPLVADAGYRVTAEERYRPSEQLYTIRYAGPEGVKKIIREGRDITVYYDGEREDDADNLAATAMTTDAVKLFHYGPSFIKHRARNLTRLPDAEEDGTRYHRRERALPSFTGPARETKASLVVPEGSVGSVDDEETRERYAAEAERMAAKHDPDEAI